MINLGKICQNSEAKFESQLTVINRALLSDKARCFSQSERALYENFIIMLHVVASWRNAKNQTNVIWTTQMEKLVSVWLAERRSIIHVL